MGQNKLVTALSEEKVFSSLYLGFIIIFFIHLLKSEHATNLGILCLDDCFVQAVE